MTHASLNHTTPVGEVFAAAYRRDGQRFEVALPAEGGSLPGVEFDLTRWREGTASDGELVTRCVGPTLDVGCGPGRMTALLSERGQICLGIDLVAQVVGETRRRGACALVRDVFDQLPGEGRWATALVADGNLGIGGDPVALLQRLRRVLAPGGRVVTDLAPAGTGLQLGQVEVVLDEDWSAPLPWAVVGADVIAELAQRAGFVVQELAAGERPIAVLRGVPR